MILPQLMDTDEAANRQYRYGSYYTVWLVSPTGERTYLGYTARKSGNGLLGKLDDYEMRVEVLRRMGAAGGEVGYKKTAAALVFTNGWKIAFGGTIREESAYAAHVQPV